MPNNKSTKRNGSANNKDASPRVAIVMGSDSDFVVMEGASDALKRLGVPHEISVVSAHRTPERMAEFAKGARVRGIQVIIAGAGGAAHLPGMVASYAEIPVVGVPVPLTHLQGEDSLLSIVQMPKGVPVATVAIGNSWNAGILAAQIVASGGSKRDEALLDKIAKYKNEMKNEVAEKNQQLLSRLKRDARRRQTPERNSKRKRPRASRR